MHAFFDTWIGCFSFFLMPPTWMMIRHSVYLFCSFAGKSGSSYHCSVHWITGRCAWVENVLWRRWIFSRSWRHSILYRYWTRQVSCWIRNWNLNLNWTWVHQHPQQLGMVWSSLVLKTDRYSPSYFNMFLLLLSVALIVLSHFAWCMVVVLCIVQIWIFHSRQTGVCYALASVHYTCMTYIALYMHFNLKWMQ